MQRSRRRSSRRFPRPLHGMDFYLVFFVTIVLAFGLVMVLSAGAVRGFSETQNSYYYLRKQFIWAIIGGVVAFMVTRIPYHFLRKLAGIGILASVILLAAVLFSDSGESANGAARWLDLGPLTIQPSEIAKVALVLYLAHAFDKLSVKTLKDLAPVALVVVPIWLLVYKQPDLGTTMLLVFTTMAMLWQTELPTKWFLIGAPAMGLSLLSVLWLKGGYQWDRILAWLDPWQYAADLGYQSINAQIAFGTGGIFGVGLGQSQQKFGFLPETYTDMIFAIIGEELGLIGTVLLIGLLILLYGRCFWIAKHCKDRFGRLLAFGLTSSIAIQTCMNLAVVTGAMPVTGITLPLVSYGGSSLVITLVQIGIILNVSRYVEYKDVPSRKLTGHNRNQVAGT